MQLRCKKCGVSAEAACSCGVAYVPAREYAARAVAESPEKSDRAIAKEIGIAPNTVKKARTTVQNCAVERRVGLDGKTRKLPTAPVQIAKYEAMKERAIVLKCRYGVIADDVRKELVEALNALPPENAAEVIRARVGISWDELLFPAQAEERSAAA